MRHPVHPDQLLMAQMILSWSCKGSTPTSCLQHKFVLVIPVRDLSWPATLKHKWVSALPLWIHPDHLLAPKNGPQPFRYGSILITSLHHKWASALPVRDPPWLATYSTNESWSFLWGICSDQLLTTQMRDPPWMVAYSTNEFQSLL